MGCLLGLMPLACARAMWRHFDELARHIPSGQNLANNLHLSPENFYSAVLLSILLVSTASVTFVWRGHKSAGLDGGVQRERRCVAVVGVWLGVLPAVGLVALASVDVATRDWSFDVQSEQVTKSENGLMFVAGGAWSVVWGRA
jgi:hypothetical protein